MLDRNPMTRKPLPMDSMPEGDSPLALTSRSAAMVIDVDQATIKSFGIFGFDSIDPRSRSFNLIRARLTSLHRERGWRSFGVVSAASQVGKSFISANVAAALSRNPRYETTLVDLDLRRGSVSAQCGIAADESMREYLDGSNAVTVPPVYAFRDQRLAIVPTRPGIVRSAEMLASERAQALYRAMRDAPENHLFIVDLPPVFANDDATTVVQRLDAYMLVAEEGQTASKEIAEASALLGTDRLAGVVLNKYRGGMMREGYGADDYYNAGYGATDSE